MLFDISQYGSLNPAALLGIVDRIMHADARQHGCDRQGVDSESRAQ
jgi:hypothetical protein